MHKTCRSINMCWINREDRAAPKALPLVLGAETMHALCFGWQGRVLVLSVCLSELDRWQGSHTALHPHSPAQYDKLF
jgi:hypothetical protein